MGSAAKKQQKQQENERKWTKTLMDAGWTVIPSVILDRQQALGLEPADVNILLHLAKYWWEKDRLPFPSMKAIAECMGGKRKYGPEANRFDGGGRAHQTSRPV